MAENYTIYDKAAIFDRLYSYFTDPMGRHDSPAELTIDELRAENIELRELVADMWRFTGTACKKYPRLFDPAAQGGQMVRLNMIDVFEQRMRELGVEAPDV